MREALLEAEKAYIRKEVPIGAVLVHRGRIIARASNSVEGDCDASCHAELLCMRRASCAFKNWRLINTVLYCTLEPCAMCAGAMILFRITRLVYGARDLRHGAIQILKEPHQIHQVAFVGGILEKEAGELMRQFFKERRKKCTKHCLTN